MASNVWGLAKPGDPAPVAGRAGPATGEAVAHRQPRLSPAAARDAHRGIMWLHAAGAGMWLFVTLLLGMLWIAGKPVPPVVVLAGTAAAAGHGVFLATHLYLASVTRKRVGAPATTGAGAVRGLSQLAGTTAARGVAQK